MPTKKNNTAATTNEVAKEVVKKVLRSDASELFANSLKFDRIEIQGLIKDDSNIILTDKAIALLAENKGMLKNTYPIDIRVEVVSYQPSKTVADTIIPATWLSTGLTFTLKANTILDDGLKSLSKFIRNAQKKTVKSANLGITLGEIEDKLEKESNKEKKAGLKYLQKVFTKSFGAISLSINGQVWGAYEVHKGTALSAPERAYGIAALMLGKTLEQQKVFNEKFYTSETITEVAPVEGATTV